MGRHKKKPRHKYNMAFCYIKKVSYNKNPVRVRTSRKSVESLLRVRRHRKLAAWSLGILER